MKVTHTIEFTDKERLAIQEVLGIVDRLSEETDDSIKETFDFLHDNAEIIDEYKYSIPMVLDLVKLRQ